MVTMDSNTHDEEAVLRRYLSLRGDFESVVELSYQAQIAPWWVMQPDLQLVLHPGARLTAPTGDALVMGLRTAISF